MAAELIWENSSTLYLKYSGTVSGNDILASQTEITNNTRFIELRQLIVDASRIEHNLSTDADVEKISAMAIAQSKTNSHIKNAIIMNANENSQTLTSYYQFLSESTGWDIQLFTTEDEARAWLAQFNL